MTKQYVVNQGVWSPREKVWGFRFWASYETLADAKKEARKLRAASIEETQVRCFFADGLQYLSMPTPTAEAS